MNLEVNAKRRSVITTIGLLSTVGLHPSAKGMHRFIDTLTPCFSSCTPVWTLSPSIPGGPYCGPHNVVSIPKIEFYCNVVHWRKFHPAYIHTARHIHSLYIVTTFQHFQWDQPLMWCLYRQFLRASTRLKNENKLCLWVWNFNWHFILCLGENKNTHMWHSWLRYYRFASKGTHILCIWTQIFTNTWGMQPIYN
jgi:hypothetical protein